MLSNLQNMTEQQVFDVVANHLLNQNQRSTRFATYGCAYHNSGGLMCAAGVLISDEEYDHAVEGNSWVVLVQSGAVPPYHSKLISDLQDIHDTIHPIEWGDRLHTLAKLFGLEFNQSLQQLSEAAFSHYLQEGLK